MVPSVSAGGGAFLILTSGVILELDVIGINHVEPGRMIPVQDVGKG